MIFPLGWISPGKNISVKNADALYFNLCHLLPLGYRRLLDPLPPFLRISFVLRWRVWIFYGTTQSWRLQVNSVLPQYYEGFPLVVILVKDGGCGIVNRLFFCVIFSSVVTMF